MINLIRVGLKEVPKADICHLTSAHDRADTRIFQKMCLSLQAHGYRVVLIVADGKPDDSISGIKIFSLPKFSVRLLRMIIVPGLVFFAARKTKAKVFHFHDPELLLVGLMLQVFARAKIIYDAHEDLPATIHAKTYIPRRLRGLISYLSNAVEKTIAARLDAVVAATPHIGSKFANHNSQVIDICNFPLLHSFSAPSIVKAKDKSRISYIGNLGVNRGIIDLVSSLPLCRNEIQLDICGSFSESNTETIVRHQAGWNYVDFHGWVDSATITSILKRSSAGIVTLKPTPNYIYSLPVKLFEYMRAELPVIASDFEQWRAIVGRYECSLFVDPESPVEIAKAIDWVVDNKDASFKMGLRGKKAVEEDFNWSIEEKKLIRLYDRLVKDTLNDRWENRFEY